MYFIERKLLKIKRDQLLDVEISNLQEWSDNIIKHICIGSKE